MWVGLTNPSSTRCYDSDGCDGILEWSDGDGFVTESWLSWRVKSDGGQDCFRTRYSDSYVGNDLGCTSSKTALCQVTCEEEATTTEAGRTHVV